MAEENSMKQIYTKTQIDDFTDDENPFRVRLNFSWFDKLSMAVVSVTLLPLRVVSLFLVVLLCWLISGVACLGMDSSKPVDGWRRSLMFIVGGLLRFSCRIIGFHRVKITGEQVSQRSAPVLVAAPHTTFFDGLVVYFARIPYVISRLENLKVPFLGNLLRLSQAVLIDRDDPDSRSKTSKEIMRRVTSDEPWQQFLVFPEGTVTNGKALLGFKTGAFRPGKTVQPVLVRYPNKHPVYTWAYDGHPPTLGFLLTMMQWSVTVELEFLEPYTPSKEEVHDANLFASNVRNLMASKLGLPLCDITYQQLQEKYYNKKFKAE